MKYIFISIKMLLVAAIAYFCVDIMYKNMLAESFILPEQNSSGAISKNSNQPPWKLDSTKNKYDIIVQRNLFNVEVEEKKEPDTQKTEEKEPEKIQPTNLSLVLWGTVTGQGQVYAVIEDKKVKYQALYEIGDVIQGAKLKKIYRHKVILSYQGKDQVLEMETNSKNVSKARVPRENINGPPTSGNGLPANDLLYHKGIQEGSSIDINTLMKQVKMRPHFTEGEPDGLMVYGIRPNSVFRQLGLKNGDILKDINGMAIVSPEDISNLFIEINQSEEARITLLRRGKIEEVNYQVKNGQYLITDFPEGIEKNKGDE